MIRWSHLFTPVKRPAPYLLFSYGITRSGSTLAYEIARIAFEQAGVKQPTNRGGKIVFAPRVDNIQIQKLQQLMAEADGPIAVKLHNRPAPASEALLASGQAKAHAVIRDPRDIALSLVDAGARARQNNGKAFAEVHTLADAKKSIDSQMPKLLRWLRQPGLLCINYTSLAFDTEQTVMRMLNHLEIDGDPARILRRMRKRKVAKAKTATRDRYQHAMNQADQDWFFAAYQPFYEHVLGRNSPDLSGITSLQSADCNTMITPPSEK